MIRWSRDGGFFNAKGIAAAGNLWPLVPVALHDIMKNNNTRP